MTAKTKKKPGRKKTVRRGRPPKKSSAGKKTAKRTVHKKTNARKKIHKTVKHTKKKAVPKGMINKEEAGGQEEASSPEFIPYKPTEEQLVELVKKYRNKIYTIKNEVKKGILGQDDIIDSVLKCLVAGGHVLLESVPGLAKTLLATLLNETFIDTKFNRVQFTPDLLPTDITGVTIYDKIKGFYVMKGPIFSNVLLADELNRSPPKVQSAMLQGMQENQVTIGRKTYDLPKPFFVMATQNPLEQQGVYPLSTAQVDRFLFKIYLDYPDEENEFFVMDMNSNMKTLEDYDIKKVISPIEIIEMQEMVKYIHISRELKEYIVNIVDATRNPMDYGLEEEKKYIQSGASPRASINLGLSAKASALLNGRTFVTPEDIRSVSKPVLRHRIMLNYEGKAKEINTDDIIEEIIKKVPVL